MVSIVTFDDRDRLRRHLDGLNDSGKNPICTGIASNGQPFLITLVGAYAEYEEVFFDSPWQSDTDHGKRVDGEWVPHPPRCEDCGAQVYGIEDLSYPVTILEAVK